MLGKILKLFLGNYNDRMLKKILPILRKVNSFASPMKGLSNFDLKAKTKEFQSRYQNKESLDSLLPEAFAALREASERTLGMRHFDVQIIGGIVLHQGNISEMRTGEGKTLVATLAIYLHSLTGKGVHVVTVNDYLAKRDCEWMNPLYEFMGLSAKALQGGMDHITRQEVYRSDIVYGVTSEFGFDYLRDNMVTVAAQKVQREHYYCLVDEVDSVLIDEARTPLIISGPSEGDTDKYYVANRVISKLKEASKFPTGKWDYDSGDYILEEKDHHVSLTEKGLGTVEEALGIKDLFAPENLELVHVINQALKAYKLYKNGRDYLVEQNGEVMIIDQNTGRKMEGRRYGDGLHQAIEAKENVAIQRENQTLATITIQNYFKMYQILGGMTGTAQTEASEFMMIYKMDVIMIPTNKKISRKDNPDLIYRSKDAKYRALIKEIRRIHESGAPLLIGTIAVESSEEIAKILQKEKIPHHVLNAKNHAKEAEIISQAGALQSITISTNMAGRGTDIVLGGNVSFKAEQYLGHLIDKNFIKELVPQLFLRALSEGKVDEALSIVQQNEEITVLAEQKHIDYLVGLYEDWKKKHDEVVSLGGLHVLGTERHEARRIDNQLRGRAGRQGDPGYSRFFLSMEDDLFRLFGSDRMGAWLDRAGFKEDDVIESRLISRMIETSQRKVEARNFEMRKHLLQYDEVMNIQRKVIYKIRDKILFNQNVKEEVDLSLEDFVDNEIYSIVGNKKQVDQQGLTELSDRLEQVTRKQVSFDDLKGFSTKALFEYTIKELQQYYQEREAQFGSQVMREAERLVSLEIIDDRWKSHLYNIDELREGISLRSYGEKNPLVEYQLEASVIFETMMSFLQESIVNVLFTFKFEQNINFESSMSEKSFDDMVEGRQLSSNQQGATQGPIKRETPKVGRNEPCSCGSGKKYKNCHGKV